MPSAAAAQGLKLKEAEEKVLETYDRPNPHFALACSECHDGRPVLGVDTADTVTFVNGTAGNVDLCYRCHTAADNIHPVNRDPLAAVPPVEVPASLPLETHGQNRGRVVCSSCHFIHARTAGLKLLRGFPQSSAPRDLEKAIFKDRRELCRACHGLSLAAKTPHKGIRGATATCSFCHSRVPEPGRKVELTQGLVQVCDFCHGATKGAHYLLVNPFADPMLKEEVAASTLPLQDGDYTCISCHNPHGGTGEPKFLRKDFVDLALKSKRVRPHYLAAFCRACHRVDPRAPRGAPDAQRLAEIPLLSESGLSKANAHPLRGVTDDIRPRVPEDWPLHQDSLSCLTCHTAGDSPVYDPRNPNFIRGGPYETQNDMCWKCHLQEELARFNPHESIQGERGCEFCHNTKPDRRKKVDIRKLAFKGDIVLLCLRCHEVVPHPANFNHNGLPDEALMKRANIVIPEDFPLDAEGRLTCATCHNPHAAEPGSGRGVGVGLEICGSCHKW
jgi:predicted CXXCH cytochrome family protein